MGTGTERADATATVIDGEDNRTMIMSELTEDKVPRAKIEQLDVNCVVAEVTLFNKKITLLHPG